MTDEQIIIDKVKCPWFNDGSCDLFYSDKEECWYRQCKDTTNCYYMETQTELKAKEQECEELKEKTINQARIIYELKNKFKKAKTFNNEIKSSKNELFNTWKRQLDELNKLKAENQKYRQVLKSIEFCLQTIKRVDGNSFDEALTNEFDFMLSKISECEVE